MSNNMSGYGVNEFFHEGLCSRITSGRFAQSWKQKRKFFFKKAFYYYCYVFCLGRAFVCVVSSIPT